MDDYYDVLTYIQEYELSKLGITLDPDTLSSGLANEMITELNNATEEEQKMIILIRNSHYLESFSNIENKQKVIKEKYNKIKNQHKSINKQEKKIKVPIGNVSGKSSPDIPELIENTYEHLIHNEIETLTNKINSIGYLGKIPEKHSDLKRLENQIDQFLQLNKILCSLRKKPKDIFNYQNEKSLHDILVSMSKIISKIKDKQNEYKRNSWKEGRWNKNKNVNNMITEFLEEKKTKDFLLNQGVSLSKIPEYHYTMFKQKIKELQELGSNFIPDSLDDAQFKINKIKLINLTITDVPSSLEESQKMLISEEYKKELQKLGCINIPKSFEGRKELLEDKKSAESSPVIDGINENIRKQKENYNRNRDWWNDRRW